MKKIGFLSFGHWTPSPQSQTRSAADTWSATAARFSGAAAFTLSTTVICATVAP